MLPLQETKLGNNEFIGIFKKAKAINWNFFT
jgi:hypothetical protein